MYKEDFMSQVVLDMNDNELGAFSDSLEICNYIREEFEKSDKEKLKGDKMKIKIYTQPTCGQCKMIKMLLQKNNIDFEACEDIEEMQKIGICHTPTIEVDGNLYTGKPMMDKIKELGSK